MEVYIIRERTHRFKVSGPEEVYRHMGEEALLDREVFFALCLDTKNNVTRITPVHVGFLNGASVHPREIFKTAILTHADSIILVHNHPSGDPTPSLEDKALTLRFSECGKVLGIPLRDHIIIGADGYVSLKEEGLCNE